MTVQKTTSVVDAARALREAFRADAGCDLNAPCMFEEERLGGCTCEIRGVEIALAVMTKLGMIHA